jgi:hypothetical protein
VEGRNRAPHTVNCGLQKVHGKRSLLLLIFFFFFSFFSVLILFVCAEGPPPNNGIVPSPSTERIPPEDTIDQMKPPSTKQPLTAPTVSSSSAPDTTAATQDPAAVTSSTFKGRPPYSVLPDNNHQNYLASPTSSQPANGSHSVIVPKNPVDTGTADGKSVCVRVWKQCGGILHRGSTCCDRGSVCTFSGQYYSQCLPVIS